MMPGERGRAVSRGSQAPRTCMHVACTRARAHVTCTCHKRMRNARARARVSRTRATATCAHCCAHLAAEEATGLTAGARAWLQMMRSSGCVATQMMPCERITPSSWPRLLGLGFRLGLALRLG